MIQKRTGERSTRNPDKPVFINYQNEDNDQLKNPHLTRIDPGQMVSAPSGFEIGYVPVVISIHYPDDISENGKEKVRRPASDCENSRWTNTYYPDV
jgi:hypothetical protein